MSDIDTFCAHACRDLVVAQEAELRRILPMWPPSFGAPAVAFDSHWTMLGLTPANTPVGELAQIVVPARRIEVRFIG